MFCSIFFFFNDTATTEIYTLSLHDALPIWLDPRAGAARRLRGARPASRGRPVGGRGLATLEVNVVGPGQFREGPARRRRPAAEATRGPGRVRPLAAARVREALRRGAAREDGRVQAAARERRVDRRAAFRGV